MDIMKLSYEEIKRKVPVGTFVKYNEEYEILEIRKFYYVIGYISYGDELSYELICAYKEDYNGDHDILMHFCSFTTKDIEKGLKISKVPLNRHCIIIHNIENVELIKRPYKWIKMGMKK